MEAPDGSPPQSLCMIRAAEFYPKSQMEKEDPQLTAPFQELAGESVKYLGRTNDGILALSNYRICLLKNSTVSETSVPLGLIEAVLTRDLFQLIVNGKDASTVKCSFETAEQCSEWQRRIQLLVGVPGSLESLFAFAFCSWTLDGITMNGSVTQNGGPMVGDGFTENSAYSGYDERLQRAFRCEDDFLREVERLNFDLNGSWRISHVNEDFKLCPSYPRKILVPCCISDETLQNVANFRASRRLPAVVWRHRKSGAVLARSSQPEVGWLGWRNSKDEQLLKALADACAFDRGEQLRQLLTQAPSGQTMPEGDSSPSSPDGSHEEVALDEVRKVLIVDARSYTSAVTNRARGGGCECIEYYPCAEIEFMNLGNIHVIRKSFQSLRQLCASPPDIPNWLGLLEKTMWLQHISGLLAASMTVCHAIEKQGRPVLVHCSDGWDRTPQIVATAQLCLDPFYRTVEGFRILVEREWLSYGHKFADRCGHGPGSDELNERCPVFLQWLDLVHQIHKQFPCSFEFSMGYLIKLAQHSLSCLFGTFLCNTLKERIDKSVFERTFSVWSFLSGPIYRNPLYVPKREKVLWPAHNVRDLSLWTEVYLGSLGNQNSIDFPTCNVDGLHGTMSPMVKTRSYGDLNLASIMQNGISRRSSDPNMTVDANLTIDSNSENNSIADIQSDRGDSPDITRKLQTLTIDFNNHDQKQHIEDLQQQPQYQEPQQSDKEATLKSKACPEKLTDANEISLEQFWHYQQLRVQKQQKTCSSSNGESSTSSSLLFSSPHIDNLKEIGCELKTNGYAVTVTSPETAPPAGTATFPASATANGFSEFLTTLGDMANGSESDRSSRNNGDNVQPADMHTTGITTVHKTADLNLKLDLLESVDLGGHACKVSSPENGLLQTESTQSDSQENLWHGSVNTSTDTLVPIEMIKHQSSTTNGHSTNIGEEELTSDTVDGSGASTNINDVETLTVSTLALSREDRKLSVNSNANCSILPKVHSSAYVSGSTNSNYSNGRPNVLSTSFSNASISSVGANSTDNQNDTTANDSNKYECESKLAMPATTAATRFDVNPMEESILILPEHQKLEISFSGKCETVLNNSIDATTTAVSTIQAAISAPSTTATPCSYSYAPFTTAYAQRRRRTSSSNSRPDAVNAKHINGSTISRFSLPGVRSLPMTPPGLPERPQIAISCPDGLAHALSEQNIRLQQIVHEHKLRVDELMREMRDMRMALLKKICPNCNNASAINDEQADDFSYTNRYNLCKRKCCLRCAACHRAKPHRLSQRGCLSRRRKRRNCCEARHAAATDEEDVGDGDDEEEQNEMWLNSSNGHDYDCCGYCDDASLRGSASACSVLDNIENASICSWEALEEHSGPSSCTSSSTQPNGTSIRWVPDHAVSRCTSCQTEFWLGRRKHHCRSCGQIFCADCSEFAAALPDEKLYSPVRLCGPCYHAVTTRAQVSQFQSSALLHLQQSAAKSAASVVAAATAAAAASKA